MIRIATRGSALARWQAEHVAALLGGDVELVVVSTTGDRRRDVPIHAIGGQGVFTKEVQDAVLDGRADVAVHSAKDLPSTTADGLLLASVPERADPRDALVGSTLDDLPTGATVATGSVRRRAQLAHARPDLAFVDLRGNMDTRLAQAANHGAVVVALAALIRLGLGGEVAEVLDTELMLPQVAQGALAIECRADDERSRARLAAIEHGPSRRAVDAERAFLAAIGSGCDLPVGALAAIVGDEVRLTALLASLDGHVVLREHGSGTDPVAVGAATADRLLHESGGATLLAAQ